MSSGTDSFPATPLPAASFVADHSPTSSSAQPGSSVTTTTTTPPRRPPPHSRWSSISSSFRREDAPPLDLVINSNPTINEPSTRNHSRTQSTPMGFTGDRNNASARPATLLSTIFKTPDSPQSEKKGFFNFTGFSAPVTPSRLSQASITSTDVVDEFAGISFPAVLQSYIDDQPQTSPAEAHLRKNLEAAVSTATDLLDRIYSAYCARTTALLELMAAAESQADDLVTQKMLTANLRTQLDHVMTEDRARVDGRIEELEAELALERRKREAAEEDEQMSLSPRRARCSKRASAASDSGFESDVDSILSRSDTRCTVVNLTAEEAEDENADCDGCYAAVGAETKTPTPLREAWSHEAGSSASKPGVWGFIKGLQQHHGHGGRYGGDLEGMRMENRYLRERVRTMEKAVEGALEAVAGRGIGI